MNPQIRDAGPSSIKVLTSHSSFSVLDALAPAFERASGLRVSVEADSAKTMLARIGVAVRAGASRPDISSVESFRRAMLDAGSIAHTVHGASGMYVPVMLERLGIAEQMKLKTVTRPGGYIARVVAAGEAEIAIQQIVELLAVPGVDLVGPLPDEIQKVFETSAAIFTVSKQPAAAEALLWFLLAPAHAGVFKEKGLEPAREK